jgi:hypothetical protein
MIINRVCRSCNKAEDINILNCSILKLEFCSVKCNEDYFLEKGTGLVPEKYKHNYQSIVKARAYGNKLALEVEA